MAMAARREKWTSRIKRPAKWRLFTLPEHGQDKADPKSAFRSLYDRCFYFGADNGADKKLYIIHKLLI